MLGFAAPASATEWLTRLDALANSRFALQFGDADVAAQLQAGLSRPLRPLSLQAYMSPADFVPAADADTVTRPEHDGRDPNEPVYPTLSQLTDVGGARAGVYWPGTGTATPPGRHRPRRRRRIDDRESLTLVPSTSTSAGADGSTVPGRAIAGEADLLVYDADVSRELHDASIEEQATLRGAPLTAAAAFLAFAVAETGGEPRRGHPRPGRGPLARGHAHGDHLRLAGSGGHPAHAGRGGGADSRRRRDRGCPRRRRPA